MYKKKVKKLKIKNIVIAILIVIIISVLLFFLLKPIVNKSLLKNKGYSEESSSYIYEKELTGLFLERDYSKTIDKVISNNIFNIDYLENYYNIIYVDKDYFINNINILISSKYDDNTINRIFKTNSEYLVNYLVENKIDDINSYLDVDIFKPDRIDRYISNVKNDYSETVLFVNMDRDKKDYENSNEITSYSVTMIVNKHNKIDENLEPELVQLTKCSTEGHYLSVDAKEAYDNLCDAATKNGLSISANSSYRSYKSQTETYNYYLKNYGQKYTTSYVATPGYSEHQTGLAIDIKSTKTDIFKNSNEYKWIINNAHKYGFILRYPEDKVDITGYGAESWHYRYVGVEIATYIYENDLTYDEYYALFLDK